MSLSEQESAWLEQHREIGTGIVANDFVPFDLLGLNNEYEGISADYLDAVAAALGLRVRVEVFRTREEARQALAQGRIDILPTVPDWLAAPSIALSAPYVALRQVEVTSRDRRIERAGAINVGYIEGHVPADALRQAYPQAHLISYGSAFLGVAAMSANKRDAFVGLGMTLAYLIDHYQMTNLRLTNFAESAPEGMHFAYRAGEAMLPQLIDRALAALPQRVRSEVRMRWSPTAESTELLEQLPGSHAAHQPQRHGGAARPDPVGCRPRGGACAHKIKGAARIVRAERVVRDREAVEAASDGGDAAGLAGAIADLQRSLGEFNDAMSRQLQVYASLAH